MAQTVCGVCVSACTCAKNKRQILGRKIHMYVPVVFLKPGSVFLSLALNCVMIYSSPESPAVLYKYFMKYSIENISILRYSRKYLYAFPFGKQFLSVNMKTWRTRMFCLWLGSLAWGITLCSAFACWDSIKSLLQ